MNIYRLGIDLAKETFQLCGVDSSGKVILSKAIKRAKLIECVHQIPPTLICMEACASAHYWARQFKSAGHEVKLIPAQYVKAFLKSQKNDRNDALAIVEASVRPTMNFVAPKAIWQQDIQALHRMRSRVVRNFTQLQNQIRGLLLEYGVAIRVGTIALKKALPEAMEDESGNLSLQMKSLIRDLYDELLSLEARKKIYDQKIQSIATENEICKKLSKVPGAGPLTVTAFVSHAGDARFYKNGRHMAASLGLVPRQNSSGGKTILLGITKRGDPYLRSLLIHGARAWVRQIDLKPEEKATAYELKIKNMLKVKPYNKVVVAAANHNARVLLTLMKTGQDYKVA